MSDVIEQELLDLSQRLLDSIDEQNWVVYTELCDPTLTAYEPEALGQLVVGMPFHEFYFKLPGSGRAKQSSITSPQVRLMGDVAVITYVRLVQRIDGEGHVGTVGHEETRIWQKQDGNWQHVHFHRSTCGDVQL
jgi:calcium/calmodulin-dependent protein kinase (CaM kinase) II